jgi:ADP-dependent NAD(P)H-hydrate dehydratase
MYKEEEIISVTPELIQELLPTRLVSSKKGDNGIVLVVGGSGIYHGAPLLSTLAALRSGVDLVYTAVPKSNVSAIRSFCPDVIVLPLPSDKFTIGSAKRLLKILPKNPHVAVIGMGMTIERQQALVYLINELKSMGTKLLLDASSLVPDILPHITGTSTIVTPHPGEFKRLFQKESSVVNSRTTVEDQESNVYKLSRKYGITIILKGYNTIVCDGNSTGNNNHQKHRRAVIRRTTPAMTVGGCGDVLSGVVAGLLTKMQNPFAASIAGVYLSGIAGGLAYRRVGLHMVATDLIEELPNAMKPFDKIN